MARAQLGARSLPAGTSAKSAMGWATQPFSRGTWLLTRNYRRHSKNVRYRERDFRFDSRLEISPHELWLNTGNSYLRFVSSVLTYSTAGAPG